MPLPLPEYDALDAVGIAAAIRSGSLSPVEVAEAAVARLEAWSPSLNALVHRAYDEARDAVRTRAPAGPLAGVPFLVKDLFTDVRGWPTRNGSRAFEDNVAAEDSLIVGRFRRAGLVLLGKTASPELGLSSATEPATSGPVRNPWDLERSAGGSSGGSAAMVAARALPAAHASDGGGSIRIPSSACGLVGLKPSRGRIPTGPEHAEVWGGLVTDGVVTRSVRDQAAFLDALGGPAPGDPYGCPQPPRPYAELVREPPLRLRIGLAVEPPAGVPVHPDCIAAAQRAARLCEQLGHRVDPIPRLGEPMDPAEGRIPYVVFANVAALLEARARRRGRPIARDELEPVTWAEYQLGLELRATGYLEALDQMHAAGRVMGALHEQYDVLITPTLAAPPPRHGELTMQASDLDAFLARQAAFVPFTPIANISGQPAITLPLHRNADGLPIGAQLLARYGDEETLLRLACTLEEASPWRAERPAGPLARPAG